MQITICDYCKQNLTEEDKYYKFTVHYEILRKIPNKQNKVFVTKNRDFCEKCFDKFMSNGQISFEE